MPTDDGTPVPFSLTGLFQDKQGFLTRSTVPSSAMSRYIQRHCDLMEHFSPRKCFEGVVMLVVSTTSSYPMETHAVHRNKTLWILIDRDFSLRSRPLIFLFLYHPITRSNVF